MADPKDKPFVVTNVSAQMISIAGQDILPGRTSEPIKPELVESVKKSPVYRSGKHLKEGKVAMPAARVIPIENATIDQAKKLIQTETDLAVLQAWAAAETRPEILALISERVKRL